MESLLCSFWRHRNTRSSIETDKQTDMDARARESRVNSELNQLPWNKEKERSHLTGTGSTQEQGASERECKYISQSSGYTCTFTFLRARRLQDNSALCLISINKNIIVKCTVFLSFFLSLCIARKHRSPCMHFH